MSKIQMTTLTPVHVGSGNFLQYNTEFVRTEVENIRYLRIVDDRKVLELIGADHLDEWLSSIERKEDTEKMIECYTSQNDVADYFKRSIQLFSDVKETDTLKECMHDGFGVPYIPGSSIKGAIRTAVLASMVDKVSDLSDKIKDKGKISAAPVEKELFWEEPQSLQSDVFRYLHVGDAYFEKETEIALRLVIVRLLNSKRDNRSQLVEVIRENKKATFEMRLKKEMRLKNMETSLKISSLNELFSYINNHTDKLVQKEKKTFSECDVSSYIENMEENMEKILSEIHNCNKGNECVLRLGHASGKRFITGAWAEKLGIHPPKTRRIYSNGGLLGFVKLKVLE